MQTGSVNNVEENTQPSLGLLKAVALVLVFYVFHDIVINLISIVGVSKKTGLSMIIGLAGAGLATLWLSVIGGGGCIKGKGLFGTVSLGTMVVVVSGSFGATILLSEVVLWAPIPDAFTSGPVSSNTFLFILGSVVLAPLFEEVFFRGQLLSNFRKRYSTAKSVWFTAILFSLFHVNPSQIVLALPAGLFFGWLVVRTGSVWSSVVSHAVVNLTSTYLIFQVAKFLGYNAEKIATSNHLPPVLLGIGIAAFAIGVLALLINQGAGSLIGKSRPSE